MEQEVIRLIHCLATLLVLLVAIVGIILMELEYRRFIRKRNNAEKIP